MKPNEKAIAHSRFKFGVDDESLRITRGYPFLTTLLAGAFLAYIGLGFGQAGCRGWLELRGGEIPTSDALINIGIGFGPVLIIALVVLQAIWPPIAVEINSRRAVIRTHFSRREFRLDSIAGLRVERSRIFHMADTYGCQLHMCLSDGRRILLVDLPTLDASAELQEIVNCFEEITGRTPESQEDSRG